MVVSLLVQADLGNDEGHGFDGFLRLPLVRFIHDERTWAWEFRDSINPKSQWKNIRCERHHRGTLAFN